ncbi:hypothetical protein C8R43DRAFT_603794 [Mycena crocata]|nr:hypothetical protein C8R43DRAFT_603794 [Mycena crocata]
MVHTHSVFSPLMLCWLAESWRIDRIELLHRHSFVGYILARGRSRATARVADWRIFHPCSATNRPQDKKDRKRFERRIKTSTGGFKNKDVAVFCIPRPLISPPVHLPRRTYRGGHTHLEDTLTEQMPWSGVVNEVTSPDEGRELLHGGFGEDGISKNE